MALNLIGITSGTGTSTSSATISYHGSTTAGDLVVVLLHHTDQNIGFTLASGYTSLFTNDLTDSGGGSTWRTYYQFSSGAPDDPSSSFSGSVSEYGWVCYTFRDASNIYASTANNGSDGSPDPPAISPSQSGDLYQIASCAVSGAASLSGYPSGHSGGQNFVGHSDRYIGVAHKTTSASDDPGSFTVSGQQDWYARTIVIKGNVSPSGTIAVTEDGDTQASSGLVTIAGTAGVTEDADIPDISGGTFPNPTGTISLTEASDTAVATGLLEISGTLIATESSDAPTAAGALTTRGTVSRTESDDTSTASGTPSMIGSSVITEDRDSQSASGASTQAGTLMVTDSADAMVGSGVFSITGSLSATSAASETLGYGSSVDRANGPKRCCCRDCDLLDDNFDRADGDPGSNWDGSGTIVSNVLDSNEDTVTVCHPSWAVLGSLYGYCTMIACDPALIHKVRVGDPAGGYEVWVEFAGTVGVGTGTMTITVKNGIDADISHEYPWEHADEYLQVCYEPGVQVSAGPSSRTDGEHPDWVTTCIPLDPHDNCWPGGLGNWTFVDGKFDDFHFEVHWHEHMPCEDCDCTCWYVDQVTGEKIIECIPATLCISVTSDDCPGFMDGTFTMYQRRVITSPLPYDTYPTQEDWTQKFTWVSESIPCPFSGFEFYFVLICGYNTSDDTKPKFRLQLGRYDPSSTMYTTFQFDPANPNSTTPGPYSNESFALVELTSTCNPIYLEFPTIIESSWQSSDPDDSCCGGSIFSDPEAPPATDSHFTVIITECA